MSELDLNLFAGAGGLARGLLWAGLAPTLLYETNSNAWKTLHDNKLIPRVPPGWEKHKGDVKLVPWREVAGRAGQRTAINTRPSPAGRACVVLLPPPHPARSRPASNAAARAALPSLIISGSPPHRLLAP